ncbi:hypothetical protein [Paenibacillus arenilitoris]|uniref:Uncharacterized protein n=1 Tax=Paenibacillus arenilitoris TaxID=2772299 RepID=A0A927H514_9BACL|nr:hypothetical protein [Paenibacillus arenilitoris]MBD2868996.1 hypothetical protein [Paenibacillus arenilitoris]
MNNASKRKIGIASGLLIAMVLLLFVIPWPFRPPADTRLILDHTEEVYIAPPCFEQAGATNYLTESTWSKAKASGYRPESACTSDRLKPVPVSLWNWIRERTGVLPSPWSW